MKNLQFSALYSTLFNKNNSGTCQNKMDNAPHSTQVSLSLSRQQPLPVSPPDAIPHSPHLPIHRPCLSPAVPHWLSPSPSLDLVRPPLPFVSTVGVRNR